MKGMKRWTLFSILVLISPNSLLQLSHRSGGPAPNTYLSSSVLSSARSSARRKQPFEIRPRQFAALFRLESSPSLPRAVPPLVTWCWALRDEGDEHNGRTGQYTGDHDHSTLLLAFLITSDVLYRCIMELLFYRTIANKYKPRTTRTFSCTHTWLVLT